MKLPSGDLVTFDSLPSTQDKAIELWKSGNRPGVVLAQNQTSGRGRLGRKWISTPGESLTASIVVDGYPDHPQPWLIGMGTALAVAGTIHCQVQWPNDLTIRGKKVGGILTEMTEIPGLGNVAVVGIGINLNQVEMPSEISRIATSLAIERGMSHSPEQIVAEILANFCDIPEPDSWDSIKVMWMLFDDTPGKEFSLPSGKSGMGLGIGPSGELLCSVDGETQSLVVADAFSKRL